MDHLIDRLQVFLIAGWEVLITLLALLVPWAPLVAWVAFWLLAVNWEKLYPVLAKGGIFGVFLIGLTSVLVWGLIAPPPDGTHHLLGLRPTNFGGKAIYVTMLFTIVGLCGTVQLSGACGSFCSFPEESSDENESDGHGHDDHGH